MTANQIPNYHAQCLSFRIPHKIAILVLELDVVSVRIGTDRLSFRRADVGTECIAFEETNAPTDTATDETTDETTNAQSDKQTNAHASNR